ncbi:MAG: FxsA family protein [Mycobacteriales bacterium]|jgi:UPF0716 protein FxsA
MAPVLLVVFILVPLVEIYVISRVGHLIGLPLTLGVLLLVSVLGAVVVKREGVRAWRNVRAATGHGRMPAREMVDGALVLVGGVLLLTPGFLTDALGFALVLPVTRPIARRLLMSLVLGRFTPAGRALGAARLGNRATRSWRRTRRPAGSKRVTDVGPDR